MKEEKTMNRYKLVTVDLAFFEQLYLKTGSSQLLKKASRSFVGLYDEKENWYIPIRANLGNKKPNYAYFPTPFQTTNPHFKKPGLDFEKAIYLPEKYVNEINNTMPLDQANFIQHNQDKIKEAFENYVLKVDKMNKNSKEFIF